MEGILTFGIVVTTCIITSGIIYSVITIRKIKETIDDYDGEIEDIQVKVFEQEKMVTDKIDNLINQIDQIKSDMDNTYDGILDEVDEMIDEVYEEAGIELEKRFEKIETSINKSIKK